MDTSGMYSHAKVSERRRSLFSIAIALDLFGIATAFGPPLERERDM